MGKTKKAASKLAAAEHEASRKVVEKRAHPAVAAAGAGSELADQPPLIGLSLAVLASGAILRQPDVARTGARMLASHLLATGLKTVLKSTIDRTRPAEAEKRGKHSIRKGRGTGRKEMNSFPSGHTAGAVAVARAVSRDHPGLAAPAAIVTAAVAAVQMPRGAHYVSDVIAGGAIGWLAEALVSAGFRHAAPAGEQLASAAGAAPPAG